MLVNELKEIYSEYPGFSQKGDRVLRYNDLTPKTESFGKSNKVGFGGESS